MGWKKYENVKSFSLLKRLDKYVKVYQIKSFLSMLWDVKWCFLSRLNSIKIQVKLYKSDSTKKPFCDRRVFIFIYIHLNTYLPIFLALVKENAPKPAKTVASKIKIVLRSKPVSGAAFVIIFASSLLTQKLA